MDKQSYPPESFPENSEQFMPSFALEIAANMDDIARYARTNPESGWYMEDVQTPLYLRGNRNNRIEFYGDVDGIRVDQQNDDCMLETVESFIGKDLLTNYPIHIYKAKGRTLSDGQEFTVFTVTDSDLLSVIDCFAIGERGTHSGVVVPGVLEQSYQMLQQAREKLYDEL